MLVLVAGFVAFWPALGADFVNYDDDKLFADNTSYRGFDAAHLRWMFSTTFMGHYHPLTWLSSALDYRISGTEPTSYHRNNLLLHALNGLVLYFVSLRLLAAALRLKPGTHPVALRGAAAAAVLLFAVHPLRVESVAWASERRDVLSVLLLLLALAAYLRAFGPGEPRVRSWPWFAASWGLLILSLLSKAWGMSFVVVVVVLDVYPLRRLPGKVTQWLHQAYRGIWLQKLPYLVLGLAAAIVAAYAQRSALQTMKSLAEWGLVERLVQSCYGLVFYAWKTVWPTRLAAVYELPYQLNPLEAPYVGSYLVAACGLVLVLLLHRHRPSVLAVTVIYVVIVAPVLGFAQSGPQFVADKYSYVCCIGWALLAGGGLLSIWRRERSTVWKVSGGVVAGAIVVLLFALTYRQTGVWHDSKSLWRHCLDAGRPSSIAHLNYGILLRKDDRTDEAIEHFRAAIELRPDSGDTWYALGNALKAKQQYAEAETAYREAIKSMTQKYRAYLNLGNMYYYKLGRSEDAIAAYRAGIEYIEASPKMFSPYPYFALGVVLKASGDTDGAREALLVARRYKVTSRQAAQELASLDAGGEKSETRDRAPE
ncbi:MAG TPA: tetratricopeptide repeat protein [Phycisphaerae bacterium]|nr:tetratricopeptide repeat protein [Phycisphaerae bacterium]